MRGRTNITARTVPKVNGDVEEYIVETGYTVRTGDFVEIVYNENYGTLQTLYNKKSLIVDNEYVLISGYNSSLNSGIITLLNINGSSIRIVNQIYVSMFQNMKYGLSKINDNIFVTTSDKLYNIKFENNSIVLKEELSLTSSTYGNLCCSDGENLFVVTNSKISVYKLVNGLLSLDNDYSYDDSLTKKIIIDSVILNGKLVIAFGSGGTNYAIYTGCYNIIYSGNDVTSINNINYLSYTNSSDNGKTRIVVIGNNFCLTRSAQISTSLEYYYVDLYEVTNAGVSRLSTNDFGSKEVIVNSLNEEYLICFLHNSTSCKLYKVNGLSFELDLQGTYNDMVSNISDENSVYFPDLDIIVGDEIIHVSKSMYHLFTFRNNVLSKGWGSYPVAKVKPYSSGSAIGFAKVGGSSGQTVKIYVP